MKPYKKKTIETQRTILTALPDREDVALSARHLNAQTGIAVQTISSYLRLFLADGAVKRVWFTSKRVNGKPETYEHYRFYKAPAIEQG